MQTVTTVGYGDVEVTSVQGRVVAILVMVAGIGFLSVLTATVASYFVKSERSPETEGLLDALSRIEGELTQLRSEVRALSPRRLRFGLRTRRRARRRQVERLLRQPTLARDSLRAAPFAVRILVGT